MTESPSNSISGALHQPSLVELAAAEIRRRILSGELPQGHRLVEERLNEELGISRPPLREAMRLLEQEGLIVKLPRFGSHVVSLTSHDYWELLTLRQSLEETAFRLTVPQVKEEMLAKPRRILADMDACARQGSPAALIEAGYRFHVALVSMAGHGRLVEVYRSMQAQLQLCMVMHTQSSPETLEDNVARHRVLLAAIASRDVDEALAALKAHGHGQFLDANR